MKLRLRLSLLAALGLGVAMAGCQEQLTAPGICPATCPGGTPVLRDTVLDALPGADSTHAGYILRGATAAGLRVANGLVGATDYGVVRFLPREDSLFVRDTGRTYTIDSVALEVTLLARDTTASGIRLALHRLPATTDSGVAFATVDAAVIPGTLIDSVTIADSIRASFKYRFVFQGSTLAVVDIPAADSGVLAMALAISGGTATGVRMGGIGSGIGVPIFRTYVTLNVPDTATAVKQQTIVRGPKFSTFVSNTTAPAADSAILAIGTPAGARALIRFPWPAYLRDSALLARATLELVPAQAIDGLPGDSAFIRIHGVRADFGAKSPITGVVGTRGLGFSSLDTVRVDVISEVQSWQARRLPHPPVLVVILTPEGTSFTEPRFYSTREAVAARRPRLRVTYQAPFDFERP